MARKEKILDEIALTDSKEKINRRDVGYYSTPDFISEYISLRMLQINNKGNRVLDPCCGKEELLPIFQKNNMSIDGIDIINYKSQYNCNFKKIDFIKYYCDRVDSLTGQINFENINYSDCLELDYDYYIFNPPYNCHEVDFIKNNKKLLKKYFSDVGVHNMYSMFISAIIDLAKPDAIIGMITHDSFLTAKNHEGLRKKIINNCAIHEITMCSTDLFLNQGADVRTSILLLQKGVKNQKEIIINNRPLNKEKLKEVLNKNIIGKFEKKHALNDIVLNSAEDNFEFLIECPNEIKALFNNERLGKLFNCVTGISTGNDKLYLSNVKTKNHTIPFYKNPGKDRFYTNKYVYLHKDFIEISKNVKNFIVRNKKMLFKSGITCSSMGVEFTASILPKDSTFGVNPNIICDENEAWWLLAYLNSNLVTYLVRGVLIRSNMITSGYVSRIPILEFTEEEKEKLSDLSKRAYKLSSNKKEINEIMDNINEVINKSAVLSKATINLINKFKKNLIKST